MQSLLVFEELSSPLEIGPVRVVANPPFGGIPHGRAVAARQRRQRPFPSNRAGLLRGCRARRSDDRGIFRRRQRLGRSRTCDTEGARATAFPLVSFERSLVGLAFVQGSSCGTAVLRYCGNRRLRWFPHASNSVGLRAGTKVCAANGARGDGYRFGIGEGWGREYRALVRASGCPRRGFGRPG